MVAFESRKSTRDTWFLRRGGGAHEFQTLTPLCEINGFICKNPYRQAGVVLKVSTRPHQQWWERVCVYLALVPSLSVLLGGEVVGALSSTAVSQPLQQACPPLCLSRAL